MVYFKLAKGYIGSQYEVFCHGEIDAVGNHRKQEEHMVELVERTLIGKTLPAARLQGHCRAQLGPIFTKQAGYALAQQRIGCLEVGFVAIDAVVKDKTITHSEGVRAVHCLLEAGVLESDPKRLIQVLQPAYPPQDGMRLDLFELLQIFLR